MENIRHSINMCCCLRFMLTKFPSKHFPSVVSFTLLRQSQEILLSMRMPSSVNTEPIECAIYGAEHYTCIFLFSLKTTQWDTLYHYPLHFAFGESQVIQKINELPRLHRQWVVKLRFDPRQWESRAPRIALLPGVVANLGPGFNCTSDAYYLCDLRETTLIQLINFFICQMDIIITHLIDMLWEINELVFRIF